MPRSALDALVEQVLDETGGDRRLDLRADLVRDATGEVIYSAGGRWDRARRAYVSRHANRRILGLHDGQVEAARWFAAWLQARKRKEHITENGRPVYSVAFVGGRRGGKSVLAMRALLTYLVDFPRSIGWIVVPSYPDMPEVERELEEQLPRAWYKALGDPWYLWTLANGSELYVKSSYDPDDLKRGRADVVVLNEAQKHDPKVFAILRPAIADRGGIVILTANPPDTARGEWVTDYVDKARAGKTGARVFQLDPKLNPHVDYAALESLKDELDERTYRREILGEFLPRTDVVFYAFSMTFNVAPTPTEGEVTREFTRQRLGQEFDRVHGVDFQLVPHMAGTTVRFFRDPDDPMGDPLVWFTDCTLVEQGSEDDLLDALEAKGYTGADAVVPDASGEWQDAERTKGRASLDVFRRRGWRKIYLPDQKSKKNPPVQERLAIGNGLMRSSTGKRKLYVDPRCDDLIRALRLWENRNGAPNKRSDYAHMCDAATYPLCRFFPRRAPPPPVTYERVDRSQTSRRRDLDVL